MLLLPINLCKGSLFVWNTLLKTKYLQICIKEPVKLQCNAFLFSFLLQLHNRNEGNVIDHHE